MKLITITSTYFILDTWITVNALSATSHNKAIPYIVARGDGSQGGGGLPMPGVVKDAHESLGPKEDIENLKRPKVQTHFRLLS